MSPHAQRACPEFDEATGDLRRGSSRLLRTVVAIAVASCFCVASVLFGVLLLPLGLFVHTPPRRRAHTVRLNRGLGWLSRLLRAFGLVHFDAPSLPEHLEGRAFLMVSNHPTLLDVVILLGAIPELTCVVKDSWHRSPALALLLRLTDYVIAPSGSPVSTTAPVANEIEDALSRGQPVLVFPEGTRSPWRSIHRLRRGAFEAAVRAGAPIQPILTTVDRPFLSRGRRLWDVPEECPRYAFEWLETIDPHRAVGGSREVARQLSAVYRDRLESTERRCASA